MRTLTAILVTLTAGSAFAHPGEHHGSLMQLMWHLVSEPDHLAMMAITVIIGAAAAIALRRRARNRSKP